MLYLYYSDLSFDLNILIYKYISRKNRIEGYYSGYTFANQLGLTAQVPYTLEIVSNEASSKCREVNVKEQRIIPRGSYNICPSAQSNISIPDLLNEIIDKEFFKNDYSEITTYFQNNPISYKDAIVTLKNIAESELF